ALRREQHDGLAVRFDRLAVILETHVVDAAAGQVDRSGDARRLDCHAARCRQRGLPVNDNGAAARRRRSGRGCIGLTRTWYRLRRGRRLSLFGGLRRLLLLRELALAFNLWLGNKILPAQ